MGQIVDGKVTMVRQTVDYGSVVEAWLGDMGRCLVMSGRGNMGLSLHHLRSRCGRSGMLNRLVIHRLDCLVNRLGLRLGIWLHILLVERLYVRLLCFSFLLWCLHGVGCGIANICCWVNHSNSFIGVLVRKQVLVLWRYQDVLRLIRLRRDW